MPALGREFAIFFESTPSIDNEWWRTKFDPNGIVLNQADNKIAVSIKILPNFGNKIYN